MKITYTAEDGTTFETEEECKRYEDALIEAVLSNKVPQSESVSDLTPEERADLWLAGKLDVDRYNRNPSEYNRNPSKDSGPRLDIREKYAYDYKRLRGKGLSDEEAIAKIKRFEQQFQEALEYAEQLENTDVTYTGPQGGQYRINSNGRKSYDVP